MRKYYLSRDRDLIDEERAMEKPGSKAYHRRKSMHQVSPIPKAGSSWACSGAVCPEQ